ncbi:MAG: PAS domain S-box protein [Bacteroidales bacterium]|nr:PAS domain S-box protein [Bacteroidales bacterium]
MEYLIDKSKTELVELIKKLQLEIELQKENVSGLKNAEENLKDCENRFHAYSKASFEAIAFFDKGICFDQNFAAQQMFGYTLEEAIGKPGTDWVAPQSRDLVKKNMLSGYEKPYEALAMRKDGTVFPAEIRGKMINYKDRKIRVTALNDISQRKKAENELQKSAEQFKRLFDAIPDAIFITRIGGENPGQILDVNISAERQTGYDRNELLEMNILKDLSIDTFDKAIFKEREGKLRGQESIRFTEKKRRKDSSEYWTDVLTIMIDFNNVNAALSVNRDITERKRVEERLINSEERFRQITENSQEWIWEVDSNGLYTFASQVMGNMLGYKLEEIVDKKHFYDLFHPEDREELKNAAFGVFKQRQPFREFINRNVTKNGKIVWLSTSGVPILDNNGNLLGYRGADINITERKQAEEELRKYREHLEELVKERTAELEERNKKLEHFNKLFVGREFRIKELRDRVKELEEKISDKR